MNSPFYKKGFPEIKEANKGKFTKWAKARGMSACQAASKVMGNTKTVSYTHLTLPTKRIV